MYDNRRIYKINGTLIGDNRVDSLLEHQATKEELITIIFDPTDMSPVGEYPVSLFETLTNSSTKVILKPENGDYDIVCDLIFRSGNVVQYASGLDDVKEYYLVEITNRDNDLLIEIYDRTDNTDVLAQELDNKQDNLVSGQNIKTINQESLLGSGNIQLPKVVQLTQEEYDALSTTDSNTLYCIVG